MTCAPGSPGTRPPALVSGLASLRPRPGDVVGYATRIALRELGRRADSSTPSSSAWMSSSPRSSPLVPPACSPCTASAPTPPPCSWSPPGTIPERLRQEAAWAHLCAVAPLPASSGKVTRHRLNPGGDRQANHALWRIVLTRMSAHPPTLLYVERRTEEGLSKKEIIRCLKRYVAREVYRHLRAAVANAPDSPGTA